MYQLYQYLLVFRHAQGDNALSFLDDAFVTQLEQSRQRVKEAPKKSSRLHLEVSQVLTSMGVDHVNEGPDDVDISVGTAADGGERGRVALEVDGPSHFTSKHSASPRRALGATTLKTRMLLACGWEQVVRVPFYEWDELEGDREAQRAYLVRALAAPT